jgi:hypothetical protein
MHPYSGGHLAGGRNAGASSAAAATTTTTTSEDNMSSTYDLVAYNNHNNHHQSQALTIPMAPVMGAPKSQFAIWNVSQPWLEDNWIRKAFCDMNLVERTGLPCSDAITNLHTDGMINTEQLMDAFVRNVVLPETCPDVFSKAIQMARALNFVIIGQPGNGRRSTVLQACVKTNISMLVVSPMSYTKGHLMLAIDYATYCRSFVIYIDDFDELCHNDVFIEEYKNFCRSPLIAKEWGHVWVILSISESTKQVNALAELVCWRTNYIKMPLIQSVTLATFLLNHLARQHILVSPSLTDSQWDNVLSAVLGASFHDVEAFAYRIASMAIQNMSIGDIIAKSRTETARKLIANQSSLLMITNGAPPPPPPQPQSAPVINNVAPRFPSTAEMHVSTSGFQSTGDGTSTHQFYAKLGTNASLECTVNPDHVIAIVNWTDVQQLYITEAATVETDGESRVTIPKDFTKIF